MNRKVLALAALLLLGAAACGQAAVAPIDLGAGLRFVPEVADPLNDSGRFASAVVTSDGRPVVAYFGLDEALEGDAVLAPRPIGAPGIPAVLLATRNANGIWTRGAIAMPASIPNVDIAFAPAIEESVKDLTAGTVTGLDLAIDGADGLHAVWGSADGLWYATGSADPASTTPWSIDKVFGSPPEGLSLAVDDAGTPWISFVSGGEVKSVEGGPGAWRVNPVAPAGPCADGGCVTATAVVDRSPAIAFTGGDGALRLATTGEGGWAADVIAPSGTAPSIAVDGADILVASYAGDAVQVTLAGGGTSAVAAVAAGSAGDAGAGTGLAVDGAGTVTVAWVDGVDGVHLAQGSVAAGFTPVSTGVLLHSASPSLAVAGDGSALFVAWYQSADGDLAMGTLSEAEFAFAVASPTVGPKEDGGMTPSGPPANCVEAEGGEVTIVAVGVAFTDGSCITVPAGEPFRILFDNQDDATQVGQHNVAIFPSANDLANPLFRGDLVSGPAQATYEVPALDAGRYFYHCDVHPQMTGTVVAEGAGGGGGGAGGGGGGGATTSVVVAMGLAFDTSTISLPAGMETTITMDNQDPGVPHNIAIFASSTDLATALFRGDLINGVATIDYTIPALEAGTYYFHCDVHPTMNGTVVVS
ncbi:MAG: cupredoxin domain-containing protein [Actinomycetota bacterium]